MILEQAIETYEISIKNPLIASNIKGMQKRLSKTVYRQGNQGTFVFLIAYRSNINNEKKRNYICLAKTKTEHEDQHGGGVIRHI